MSSPKIFRRRIYRKRRLSQANYGTKQNATPFFDFGTEYSFFSGNTKETAIDRQGDKHEMEKENQNLQRTESPSTAHTAPVTISSYVKSLSGKGSALPVHTRQFFEPRFGVDFSNVKVHDDQESAFMASSIHSKAFTHKNHIVFNKGQYDADSETGKKLLSHELTHVVQQDNSIKRMEIENHEEEKLQKKELVSKSINTAGGSVNKEIQRQQDALPNVSQGNFDSCGAASIIAAIMIHDKQLSTIVPNNSGFIAAANIVLSYFTMHQTTVIAGLVTNKRITNDQAENLYWTLRRQLLRIRNDSRLPGASVAEVDYQILSAAIYALYVSQTSGLSQAAIGNITNMLGMTVASEGGVASYSDIITHTSLRGLAPGQIAQIGWYVRTGGTGVGMHAFLIGRLNNGTWYLYDQGPNPPVRFTSSSLNELDAIIRAAAATGSYWLFTGSTSEFRMMLIGGWTGINILGSASEVLGASANLLSPGTRLAEIDEGIFTWGSDVNVVAFHSEYYDLPSAQSAASGLSGNGGAIIEMPKARFLLFTTSLVSDANKNETSIDAPEGGEFTMQRFFHAWLQLRSSSGIGSFFSVY
jgi:hypothetical protein